MLKKKSPTGVGDGLQLLFLMVKKKAFKSFEKGNEHLLQISQGQLQGQ